MSERTWPENAKPTPEQLADWIVTIPREERIERAEVILDAMDRADACFLHNHAGLLDRLEAAEALHRDLVSRLGFGNNITEPMADNDTIVAWFEQQSRDANEWQESQLWRNDCYEMGHPDDEDCWECDPRLRLEAAEAKVARCEALADEWEAGSRSGYHISEYGDLFANDLRAALSAPQPADVSEGHGDADEAGERP